MLLREGRWCETCGAPWISTLAERAAAGWLRWCDPCGAERAYHVTPPSTWRAGRCACLLCQARSALAASRSWRPRRMAERPRTDPGAKTRPYIDENERRGAHA